MEADVILNGNAVQLKGNVEVTANERELDVSGPVAGYAFHDRSSPNDRYVLYANQGKAFLWRDGVGNILTIEGGVISPTAVVAKQMYTGQLIVKGAGPTGTFLIRWDESHPIIGKPGPGKITEREMDLVKVIQDLQQTISDLEKRLRNAEAKVGISTPIIIKR